MKNLEHDSFFNGNDKPTEETHESFSNNAEKSTHQKPQSFVDNLIKENEFLKVKIIELQKLLNDKSTKPETCNNDLCM